jgi:hypothetical protein
VAASSHHKYLPKYGDVKQRIWQNIVDKAEPHDVKKRVGAVFFI